MRIIRTIEELLTCRKAHNDNLSVGLVPTMGALHEGHISLIRRCRKENDICVMSLFVNPTQFNDKNDLRNYPATFEKDADICNREGVDILFSPEYKAMYPDNFKYRLLETDASRLLCGAHRPGHFDGVLTVVLKLFNLIRPNRAYFGEKDYQQMTLINGMVKALFLPVDIVPCPIVREADGLAMSSRNLNLSEVERKRAGRFPEVLSRGSTSESIKQALDAEGFKVDYVQDFMTRRCAAVNVGSVRLIDNVPIAKGN